MSAHFSAKHFAQKHFSAKHFVVVIVVVQPPTIGGVVSYSGSYARKVDVKIPVTIRAGEDEEEVAVVVVLAYLAHLELLR